MGGLKSFPQTATLKTASAENRQLNKQLGIADGHEGAPAGSTLFQNLPSRPLLVEQDFEYTDGIH